MNGDARPKVAEGRERGKLMIFSRVVRRRFVEDMEEFTMELAL